MKALASIYGDHDDCGNQVDHDNHDNHDKHNDHDDHDDFLDHDDHLEHDDHLDHVDHLDHDGYRICKEIGGCTQGRWKLSDQMRIAASISQIDNDGSLTQLLTNVGIEPLGQLKSADSFYLA